MSEELIIASASGAGSGKSPAVDPKLKELQDFLRQSRIEGNAEDIAFFEGEIAKYKKEHPAGPKKAKAASAPKKAAAANTQKAVPTKAQDVAPASTPTQVPYTPIVAPAAAAPKTTQMPAANKGAKVQPPAQGAYFGAWLGDAPDPNEWNFRVPFTDIFIWSSQSLSDFREAEKKFGKLTGKSPAVIQMYEQWSDTWKYNPFPDAFVHTCDSMGAIPMITWEPSGLPFDTKKDGTTYLDEFNREFEIDPNTKKPNGGPIYEYALEWAQDAKAYGKPFFLRPFHEMNLATNYPWTGWQNGGDAGIEKFKTAWKNLYKLFREVGADNATFIWCPNNKSIPAQAWNDVTKYWPGAEYVDWVGIDGYMTADEEQLADVFSFKQASALKKDEKSNKPRYETVFDYFATLGKPIMICETSARPFPAVAGQYVGKEGYIRQLGEAVNKYKLSGVILFDENKEGKGATEFNWSMNAPVQAGAEVELRQLEEGLEQSKKFGTPDDIKYYTDAIAEYKKAHPSNNVFYNPALGAIRTVGTKDGKPDGTFVYQPVDVSVNTGTANQDQKTILVVPSLMGFPPVLKDADGKKYSSKDLEQVPVKKVRVPDAMSGLEGDVARTNFYFDKGRYVAPRKEPYWYDTTHVENASYIEKLSGYQPIVVASDPRKIVIAMNNKHREALAELDKVPKTSRRYLEALAQKRDIYAQWQGEGVGEEKDAEEAKMHKKALAICDEMEAMLNDNVYLRSFDSRTLQAGVMMGLFTKWPVSAFDVTRFEPWDVENFKASVHATRGYVFSSKTATLGKAMNEYQIALALLDSNAAKGNALLQGWNGVFGDPAKDLKININIGMLRIQRQTAGDINALAKVIAQLEIYAYSKKVEIDGKQVKLNPRQKVEAKLELAYAYLKYAEFALSMPPSPQRDAIITKANRALIISRELFTSELGWKAGEIMDTMAAILSSPELQ